MIGHCWGQAQTLPISYDSYVSDKTDNQDRGPHEGGETSGARKEAGLPIPRNPTDICHFRERVEAYAVCARGRIGWVKKISKSQELAPTHCRDKSAKGISSCPGLPTASGSVVGLGKRRGAEQALGMRQIILVTDRGARTRRTTSLLLQQPRDKH